ncbi:MAG: beta-CASP ribonuclease aCPSF1 [Desulfurococcales archaeon]|nr:beta-CASP ribonuclease aCPSF1 [Desulfurococcales archaeon]
MAIQRVESGLTGDDLRKRIILEIYKVLGGADITSIEFEGPEIAVYIKNPQYLTAIEDMIKELAKNIRKRIVVRTDPKHRKTKEATIKYIMENIPPDAGVSPSDIQFDEVLGEVRVLAEKPGKLMGKGKAFRNQVLAETGWRLEVYRKPPLMSKTLNQILGHLLLASAERKKALREIGERIYRTLLVGSKYVRVTGLGSFGEVGRSSILLDTGESRVLLDAGASPSGYGPESYPYFMAPEFRIEELDAVVITHAHLDHVGMLPLLYKYGFRGPTYATPPTRDIMLLVLKDYIELAKREGREPPYELRDVNTLLTRTIVVNYNVVTDVAPDIKLTFTNAGHILGSALAHLHVGQGLFNLLYTGDFKYYRIKGDKSTRLLPPANDEFHRVEAMIMEATYGAQETQSREKAEEDLINMINRIAKNKGKILIPVMAVGRGQEILVVINRALKEGKIPEIPVYVDGMVYEVTAIYTAYPELLAKPIRDAILHYGDNPFLGPTTVYVDHSTRDEVLYGEGPAIVLATSGMMTGGPVIEYFKYFADDERNILAFVSYQAPGTLGRRLMEGEREIQLPENSHIKTIKVKMDVVRIEGFTGHATRSELQLFLKYLKPKPKSIILNHGEPGALLSMASTIKTRWSKLGFEAPPITMVPENLDTIRLYPRSYRLHAALEYGTL